MESALDIDSPLLLDTCFQVFHNHILLGNLVVQDNQVYQVLLDTLAFQDNLTHFVNLVVLFGPAQQVLMD